MWMHPLEERCLLPFLEAWQQRSTSRGAPADHLGAVVPRVARRYNNEAAFVLDSLKINLYLAITSKLIILSPRSVLA